MQLHLMHSSKHPYSAAFALLCLPGHTNEEIVDSLAFQLAHDRRMLFIIRIPYSVLVHLLPYLPYLVPSRNLS